MTSESSAQPDAQPAPAPAGWTGGDLVIGTALAVQAVSVFLPWFTVTGTGLSITSGTATGPRVHGYLWIVLVLAILGLAVLVARDLIARSSANLPSPEQLLVGTTGLALLLIVLGIAVKPPTAGLVHGWTQPVAMGPITIASGWSYGGFVALFACAAALVTAFATAGPLHSAGRAARAAGQGPAPG